MIEEKPKEETTQIPLPKESQKMDEEKPKPEPKNTSKTTKPKAGTTAPKLPKKQEKLICDKLDNLISGFHFISKNVKNMKLVTPSRGMNILLKLSRQEFRDFEILKEKRKAQESSNQQIQMITAEQILGKRERAYLNVERSLDQSKLIKASNTELKFVLGEIDVPAVVQEMGSSKERLKQVIDVSKFKAKLLKKEVETSLEENGGKMDVEEAEGEGEEKEESEGESKEEELVEVVRLRNHHLNILKCVMFSELTLKNKLSLLYDYLIELFDQEEDKSYFEHFLLNLFESLEKQEKWSEADIIAWEEFVMAVPDSSTKLVMHIYKMSKQHKGIGIFPHFAQYLPGKQKEEAIKLIMKLGSTKILKKAEKIFSKTHYFEEVMAPESVKLFNKLKENSEKYEDATVEKIKRRINPLFMCLLHFTHLFIELIKDYHKLPRLAKEVITEKFTTILKSILKSNEIAGLYFEALIVQREESNCPEDYQDLIEAFKQYVKIQGKKVYKIFSEAIVNYVLKSGKLEILEEFSQDILIEKVVKIVLHQFDSPTFSLESINKIMEYAKMNKFQMLIEIIFYADQNSSTLPKLTQLQKMIMSEIDLEDFAKPEFKQMLLLRLNKILPNAQLVRKETKPVPILFFPFLLKIIYRLHMELKMNKPWEIFIELVKLLIKAKKQSETVVWAGLLRFAKFDRQMTEMKIAPLLPLDDKEKLFNEAF